MNEQRHISEEDISAYLDGQLPPEQAASVEQAVAADPDMARELESLRQMRELIGGLEPEPAPADMAEKVLRRVRSRRRPRNRLVVARWVTIAATLLVVFGGAMVMFQTLHQENASKDLQEKQTLADKSSDELKTGSGWKQEPDNILGVRIAAMDKLKEQDDTESLRRKNIAAGRIPQEETVVIYVDSLSEGQKAVEQVLASNSMELVPVGQKALALNQAQNFAVPSARGRANSGELIPSQNETVYLANATPRQNYKIVSELRMRVIARQSVSQLPDPIYNSNITLDASNGAKELMKYQDGRTNGRFAKADKIREDEKKYFGALPEKPGEEAIRRDGAAKALPEPVIAEKPEVNKSIEPIAPPTPEPLPTPSAPAPTAVLESSSSEPAAPVKPTDTYRRQTTPTAAEARKSEPSSDAAAKSEKYKELWKRREENLGKDADHEKKLAQETKGKGVPATRPQLIAESGSLPRPASAPRQQQLRIVLRVRKPVTLNASQRENLKQAEMRLYQQNQLHRSQLRALPAAEVQQK